MDGPLFLKFKLIRVHSTRILKTFKSNYMQHFMDFYLYNEYPFLFCYKIKNMINI